jgi:uridine phosphorylase
MKPMITPEQVISVAREAGLEDENLKLSGAAVLTFSKGIVDRMEEVCGLKDAEWLGPRVHPYGGPEVVKRGRYRELDVIVIVPMMGASPLSCVIEDLVACGVKAIFLACAAWSLGEPVKFGDILVPSFTVGMDGTSIHYGNSGGRIDADLRVVAALADSARERETAVHIGGNACCEALYRITPEMVDDFRTQGCLSMENGEAAVLFAVCRALGVTGGAIFQPYIDLTEGWNPGRFDEAYDAACRLQADIVLNAALRLQEEGVIRPAHSGPHSPGEERGAAA